MRKLFGSSVVGVALLVGSALLAGGLGSGAARAATGKQKTFTIYAVATRVQYVNYADGLTRAKLHNPFNADTALPPPPKKKGVGFGNSAFFSFKLYTDSTLKQGVGSASYTCTFDLSLHASCDAYYALKGGTLFASGPVSFSQPRSTLAVTGGTSKYLGANGEVVTTGPGAKASAANESRFDFVLLG